MSSLPILLGLTRLIGYIFNAALERRTAYVEITTGNASL
jgi:hypothetical protein